MPFFEPLPEPPPESLQPTETAWAPPQWDRPSEGTLPAVVAVSRILGRTDNAVLALDHLRVYPNGFQLAVSLVTSPRLPPELRMGGFASVSMMAMKRSEGKEGKVAAPPPPPAPVLARRALHMGPRMGVRFSGGQRAEAHGPFPSLDVPKDERGFPTEPVMRGGGGGGGNGHFRFDYWVFPLPTPGPLDVFAEWPTVGIKESSLVISGDDIRATAARAIVLWS